MFKFSNMFLLSFTVATSAMAGGPGANQAPGQEINPAGSGTRSVVCANSAPSASLLTAATPVYSASLLTAGPLGDASTVSAQRSGTSSAAGTRRYLNSSFCAGLNLSGSANELSGSANSALQGHAVDSTADGMSSHSGANGANGLGGSLTDSTGLVSVAQAGFSLGSSAGENPHQYFSASRVEAMGRTTTFRAMFSQRSSTARPIIPYAKVTGKVRARDEVESVLRTTYNSNFDDDNEQEESSVMFRGKRAKVASPLKPQGINFADGKVAGSLVLELDSEDGDN